MKKLSLMVSLLFLSGLVPACAAEQPETVQPPVAVENSDQAPKGDAQKGDAAAPKVKKPVSFGDYRSTTLATKAWNALEQNDIESVLAYTNKCIQMYGAKAKEMQASLKEYPTGKNDDIFKWWAINDVSTCYYIQGLAYMKANMKDEAKEAFNKVINEFSFGQAWDTKGWFWKPAEASKDQLTILETGLNIEFGNYTSSEMTTKAWGALADNNLKAVELYVNKTVTLYSAKAKEMQASLKEYPWESKDKILSFWALNDVGTSLFILGQAYQNAGKKDEATKAYKQVINDYFYSQCWDPKGWFWKPAEAAQQKLGEMDNV